MCLFRFSPLVVLKCHRNIPVARIKLYLSSAWIWICSSVYMCNTVSISTLFVSCFLFYSVGILSDSKWSTYFVMCQMISFPLSISHCLPLLFCGDFFFSKCWLDAITYLRRYLMRYQLLYCVCDHLKKLQDFDNFHQSLLPIRFSVSGFLLYFGLLTTSVQFFFFFHFDNGLRFLAPIVSFFWLF